MSFCHLLLFVILLVAGMIVDGDLGQRVDPGKPLFLSPYISQGKITEAQRLSRVVGLKKSVESYSGYITVNKSYKSNLFFWYIPAQHANSSSVPLMMWLDGGPGTCSVFGLFVQSGPFKVDKHFRLVPRKTDWSLKYSMLYVDQPVGTGFSFTKNDAGYATTEVDVARDLYTFLLQFFKLFPHLQHVDFYIGGESYAGKYVPAISYKIHTENPTAHLKMNLKGLFIGGPFTDPVSMLPAYSEYLFNVGMLDEQEAVYFQRQTDKIVALINMKNFKGAMSIFTSLMLGVGSYLYNVTGFIAHENIMEVDIPPDLNYYVKYVESAEVRRSIHVGNVSFHPTSETVFLKMSDDFLQSVKPWFVTLLNSGQYKILLFNGQLDIIVCAPTTERMLMTMATWKDLAKYKQAKKKIWRLPPPLNKDVAGYVRETGMFTQVIVRGSGHIVPHDQPERTLDMLNRFIENKSFSSG